MTLRITYKTKDNQLDDYIDTFDTMQSALDYMAKVNRRMGAELILDIVPVND
jgi:hypothetical protein